MHGMSFTLADILANLFSRIISTATVPSIFTYGVIIPILKKSSCDLIVPSNYRPMTLSSIHSKIVEMLISPGFEANDCQYSFREGRGPTFVTSTINDCATYYIDRRSSLLCCSLDAEKCFDGMLASCINCGHSYRFTIGCSSIVGTNELQLLCDGMAQ